MFFTASTIAVLAGSGIAGMCTVIGAILSTRPSRLRTKEIHAQLNPNGGASVRDAVDRTEANVGEIRASMKEVNLRVAILTKLWERHMEGGGGEHS